jgi:hypothetical protein
MNAVYRDNDIIFFLFSIHVCVYKIVRKTNDSNQKIYLKKKT